MLDWLNDHIDRLLQPKELRPENLGKIPEGSYIPIPSDIVLPSIFTALLFIVLRHLFDSYVATPLGKHLGLKDNIPKKKVIEHPVLEKEYRKNKNPDHDVVVALSKKIGLPERSIEIWYRKRRKQDKTSDIKKFCDGGWSFVFYLLLSWYGIYVLWDKPWVWNREDCWKDWPLMPVTNDVYWYYLLEVSYYISYIYMLFTDHKRKDFLEFFIHHNVTVVLMILSWSMNTVRIGALVLCVHDPVDYILAFAKSSAYVKKDKIADVCFLIFVPLWVVTRLFIYPYVVLYSCFVELPALAEKISLVETLDSSYVIKLLKGLLLVLQILHIIWTVLIIKSAMTKFTRGKLQDARSDTENSEQEDGALEGDLKEIMNNNTGNKKMKTRSSSS